MARLVRDRGLSMVLFGLFALFLAGQSVAGWKEIEPGDAIYARFWT